MARAPRHRGRHEAARRGGRRRHGPRPGGDAPLNLDERVLAFAAPDILGDRSRALAAATGAADLAPVLRHARRSGLHFEVARAVARVRPDLDGEETASLRVRADASVAQLEASLAWTRDALEGLPFVVMKTFKATEAGVSDLDVYAPRDRRDEAAARLLAAGAEAKGPRTLPLLRAFGLGGPDYQAPGLHEIDLYEGLPWGTLQAWPEELMLERTRERTVGRVRVAIPSAEGDLLGIVGGTLFTDGEYTLKDVVAIVRLLRGGVDRTRLEDATTRHGWWPELQEFLAPYESLARASEWPAGWTYPRTVELDLALRALAGAVRAQARARPAVTPALARDVLWRHVFGRFYRVATRRSAA